MPLDTDIRAALEALQQGRAGSAFDPEAYIKAFESSAQAKAASVLELLAEQQTFSALKPVFLSIGGGDGAELQYLLEHSTASAGVLIEGMRTLADLARARGDKLQGGKKIEIFEGDAMQKIHEAVSHATSLIAAGKGDYLCVTCHAVLHELFDRGVATFDPSRFFAEIFADSTTSTLFTYREPGIPEKWPETVLLQAQCEPQSLLLLAKEICRRHAELSGLTPEPHVLGDHVRMNRALAMEVLAKLFYLADLAHEIEERSTAVNHRKLTNHLWYAIGDRAREASRANITSISQPTASFTSCWQRYGVTVLGVNDDDASTYRLSVAESQTRVIAWRLAEKDSRIVNVSSVSKADEKVDDPIIIELSLAAQCLRDGEEELLAAVLAAKARAWIESVHAPEALALLEDIRKRFSVDHAAYLWSHYSLCLARLFAGQPVKPSDFSQELEVAAGRIGASVLFKAERMEFHRKCGQLDEALQIAHELQAVQGGPLLGATDVERYVSGTTAFLIGNLLRHGGSYRLAWEQVNGAQSIFRSGSPAQATELAHCYYAKAVCVAMTGASQFDAPFADPRHSESRRFANALITLSYSHAAWFVGDVMRARQYALQAGDQFGDLGFSKYAARAKDLASLLAWWQSLQSGQPLEFELENGDIADVVKMLVGHDQDCSRLSTQFSKLRPSVAIGLLQFWQAYGNKEETTEVLLPPILRGDFANGLKWDKAATVQLNLADQVLRGACSIPIGLRVPLIAD